MVNLRKAAEMALEALDTLLAENNGANREYAAKVNQKLRQALTQPEQKPVGYVTDSGKSAYILLGVDLEDDTPVYATPPHYWGNVTNAELVEELRRRGMMENLYPEQEAFHRLIRIMGTFDLATGHANSWDELLDSLESELCDVLGYYRESLRQALAQPEQEPVLAGSLSVRYFRGDKAMTDTYFEYLGDLSEGDYTLYTAPPKREWVGLTDEERQEIVRQEVHWSGICRVIEAKLKEKNT